jgi:uncharacterized protein (TIGR00730 family)
MNAPAPGKAVAVFGSSEPRPPSPAWHQAYDVGRLLAETGFVVVNGGYGGVMEASARGAREAGGRTIGVTTTAFAFRGAANPWIETERRERDLFDRTRGLIEEAAGFVVLPGRSGTLAELGLVWALHKAGLLGGKPIQLVGQVWEDLLPHLRRLDLLDAAVLEITEIARGPGQAVERLATLLLPARTDRSVRPG